MDKSCATGAVVCYIIIFALCLLKCREVVLMWIKYGAVMRLLLCIKVSSASDRKLSKYAFKKTIKCWEKCILIMCNINLMLNSAFCYEF